MKILIAIVILFFNLNFNLFAQTESDDKPYVLVVSLDGFRWDYPKIYNLPYFDSIEKIGVKAKSFKPCFPTVTFPNHYSMATGLYPENHGIVQNKFYDNDLNITYKISDRNTVMDGRFYGGEPIWATAEKQGIKTTCFYWVGSEAKIRGIQPTYWKPYENNIPFFQRIDTIVYWFQLNEKIRPHLVMFYLPEPDGISHDYGPISEETGNMVKTLDSLVWVLIKRVNDIPEIGKKINIIVVSDHGMAKITENKNINIDKIIKQQWIKGIYGYNPTYNIIANENCKDSIYRKLVKNKNIKVWKREDVPKRFHYNLNKRIGDIVILANNGWSIIRNKDDAPNGGAHGYDNNNKEMHGILYALGPIFKKSKKIRTIENINLYPLIAEILQIKSAKNDGKLSKVKKLLLNKSN